MPDNPHGFDDDELQEHRDAEVAPRKQTAVATQTKVKLTRGMVEMLEACSGSGLL